MPGQASAGAGSGIEQLSLGLDGDEIGLPAFVEPMRARPVREPFDSPDYLFETRWGGIRVIVSIAGGEVRLYNRRLGDLTDRFPELSQLTYAASDQPLILDGEIVIVDEKGQPNFDAQQWRLRLIAEADVRQEALRQPACFLASDVLFRGREWLLREPLHRRKRILADLLHRGECLYVAEYFDGEGRALFDAAADSQLEGMLAKPRDGLYAPGGYGGGWLAISRDREELVVGGYSMQITAIGRSLALLLGAYQDGKLTFVASVEPPSDDRLREELLRVLNALQVDQAPFAEPPPYIACWVRPELVVSVRFADGEAEFERVRLDVAPDECLLPGGAAHSVPAERRRPLLTLMRTLALPFDEVQPPEPRPRPALRLLGDSA